VPRRPAPTRRPARRERRGRGADPPAWSVRSAGAFAAATHADARLSLRGLDRLQPRPRSAHTRCAKEKMHLIWMFVAMCPAKRFRRTLLQDTVIGPRSNFGKLISSLAEGKPQSLARSTQHDQNRPISAKNPADSGRASGEQEGAKVAAHRKHLAWDAIQTSPLHSNTCDRGMSCLKSTVRVQQHCFRTCK